MTASLSDSDISILSDIGQFSAEAADAEKQHAIERLCRNGFIAPNAPGGRAKAPYSLTAKGEEVLTSRGAGLNEA